MKKGHQPKATGKPPETPPNKGSGGKKTGADLPLSLVHIKDVRKGDIVVLRTPRILSRDQQAAIIQAVHNAGLPVKVLVLEDGMELDVIRPPKEKQKAKGKK